MWTHLRGSFLSLGYRKVLRGIYFRSLETVWFGCVCVCLCVCVCVNRSLGAGSLDTELWSTLFWAHGLKPTRAFCPWDFPGKNTGVGYHLFLHGLFPTQGSNSSHLLHRWILYHWATWAAPIGLLHTPNKDTKNGGFALWMQVNTSHNQIKVLLCFVHFKWFFLPVVDIFLNVLLKKEHFLSGVITKTQGFISISRVIRQQ